MRATILFLIYVFTTLSATGKSRNYGSNILSAVALANNTGPGFGLQYETMISNSGKLSLVLPLSFCSSTVSKSRSPGGANPDAQDRHPLMVFVAPGIRYYPTTSNGIARYSIGANVMFGRGTGAGHTSTNGTNQLESRQITGLLLANAITFQITPHIRTGLELSLGIGVDDGVRSAAGPGVNPLGQISFALGYRW
jgi:hypothetical protein